MVHLRALAHASAFTFAMSSVVGAALGWPLLVNACQADHGWVLTEPTRRLADAPPPAPPPLPIAAHAIKPATFDMVVRRGAKAGKSQRHRQTVSRTSAQVHLAGNDGREWLFERNPIDPRRVSATMVEHASKAVVLYDETDLRMTLGIRGWADVLALGFHLETLERYQRTAMMRSVGGVRFVRYVGIAKDGSRDELWWSEEHVLPRQFTIGDGASRTSFALEHVRAGADVSLLRPPAVRFPEYRVFDLASWLEKH